MTDENTLLDYDLGEDLDFEPAPADTETQVKIERCSIKESKAGNNLQVILSIPDFPDADDVFYTVWLPQPEDEPKDAKRKKIALRKFYEAFDINYSGPVDYKEDLAGATSWAILSQDEYQGVVRNQIKSFVKPSK